MKSKYWAKFDESTKKKQINCELLSFSILQ